ncbi:MAG: MFS transporter [Acidobacteria bacterium]|nr:MFS transporter [Acidobacteriota bacterium]
MVKNMEVPEKKNPVERLMSLFSEVRAEEVTSALLLALTIFLLLGAYYILKPVREALILSEQGAEVKSYSAAGQAVLLLGLVPLYGWVASKVSRIRLLSGLTLFFVGNLVLFWFFGTRGVREGVVFFIWLGIFNLFMVSQFWAFANDIYTEEQGKRLFPFIGIGMSVGALAGASSVDILIERFALGPYSLMLLACGILLICLFLILVVNARELRFAPREIVKRSNEPLGKEGGFQLLLNDRYLFWIAGMVVLLNVVNTTGEYVLGKLVVEEMANTPGDPKILISQFYSKFYFMTNLLGLVLQAFVTSRVIRYMGVRGALFILPLVALASYSVLALAPLLAVVRWTKIAENSTEYSIMNTVRHALWLPTTREAKYKAKAAVDTFCQRGGDVLQAGIVYVGTSVGAGIAGFSWLNVVFTLVWLFVASRIFLEHRRRTAGSSAAEPVRAR